MKQVDSNQFGWMAEVAGGQWRVLPLPAGGERHTAGTGRGAAGTPGCPIGNDQADGWRRSKRTPLPYSTWCCRSEVQGAFINGQCCFLQRFGQGWVRMANARDIFSGAFELHDGDRFGNQF